MSCRKQAGEFSEPPAVININSSTGISTGGGTVRGFRKAASEYRKSGDCSILKGVLKTQKNLQPRRVALISYLDGWGFIHEILKSEDWKQIDTVIVLEGLNTRSTNIWVRYANKGRLWMAYSQTPHKTASCHASSRGIVQHFINEREESLPSYFSDKLDKSVSIYSKNETPKTKIYHEDPLKISWVSRSVAALQYAGKQAQDRTYIQQYVQPRLWRWLSDIWKDPTNGIVF